MTLRARKPRPGPERLPQKSAAPLFWVALIIAAAAVLAIAWNLLQ